MKNRPKRPISVRLLDSPDGHVFADLDIDQPGEVDDVVVALGPEDERGVVSEVGSWDKAELVATGLRSKLGRVRAADAANRTKRKVADALRQDVQRLRDLDPGISVAQLAKALIPDWRDRLDVEPHTPSDPTYEQRCRRALAARIRRL